MMRNLLLAYLLLGCSGPDDGGDDDDGPGSPPHPCAGALDRTLATDFYDAARCLFDGPDAPQQGVTASFDRQRIAIVRGRLLDDGGAPIAGADVSIASFGHTVSRSDGTFDVAVNGGTTVVARFVSVGRIAAQRDAVVRWRRFTVLGDVTLRARAEPVAVQLGTATIADGATSDDASGHRSSALYFAPGTTATIDTASGPQTLAGFHVHTTEFTVGDAGPSAMPGDLPATSAYTYAIDFAVDEAIAAGSKHVTFDPPAIHYVDNFLHFPVGATVPNGYFDADLDRWIAGDSGRVVQVIDGGALAGVDPISDAERRAIAARFAAGKTLWRVPIAHFSPWDHNWPFQPPADALPPYDADATGDEPRDCKTTSEGSIIGCDDRSLGEVIAIAGTPWTLHYQSERSRGRSDSNDLTIQLSGATIPSSLKRIDAEIEILGAVTARSFAPAGDVTWQFAWDGKDAYDRAWQGRQTAHVRVGYVYDGTYDQTTIFGAPGTGPITGDRTRQEVTLWKDFDVHVGKLDAQSTAFGGWTISPIHVFDAAGGVLALGDGTTRHAETVGSSIATIAGTGDDGSTGDGGPATQAKIDHPHGIVVTPDGSIVFSEDDTARIRKIAPDGTITTIAGTGTSGFSGDGGPAIAATLDRPLGIALAPDGTLFVADGNNARVRKIAPDGVITTYAGGGTLGPDGNTGDGGPATAAVFVSPHALALGKDGALYIADDARGEIRRVAPDGTIGTVAGGGTGVGNEGDLARSVALDDPLGLAVGPNQELYVTEYEGNRVRRIDPAGTITTVIGLGSSIDSGIPARAATIINPHTVDIGADGRLYITEEGFARVREITPDGLVVTVAGGGTNDGSVDQVDPLTARFVTPRVVFVDRAGSLLVGDWDGDRIRKIRTALPGYLDGETVVGSQEGDELYVFDRAGRHLRTLDALTGAARMTATYDATGRLTAIADRDGNVTTIEPALIVAPNGARTSLTLDDGGNLASVGDPAGATTTLGYDARGLLTSLVEPRGDAHQLSYDAAGRLVSDASPAGWTKTLASDPTGVTMTARAGTTTHSSFVDDGATTTRTFQDAAGLISTSQRTSVGLTLTTPTEVITATYAGDPRFGLQSPYANHVSVRQGAMEMTIDHQRTATLTDATNPLTLQQLVETTTINGNTTTSTYDAATRTRTIVSPEGRVTTTTSDPAGHLTTTRRGTRTPVTYAYDARGHLASVAGYAVAYDAANQRVSATDPLGGTTRYAYDAASRMTSVTRGDGSRVELAYDLDDNLTTVGGHVRTFGPGNLIASDAANGVTASQHYDSQGRATSFVRADGIAGSLAYDAADRIASVAYGSDIRTLSYSATTGQLVDIRSATAEISIDYQGSIPTLMFSTGPVTSYVQRTFDSSLLMTAEDVAGSTIDFTHDRDGLITSAGAMAITSDANGLVAATTLGSITDSWSYDAHGDPAHYRAGSLYDVQITRDALGRIAQRTETIGGVSHLDTYGYDARGRLISQPRGGATAANYTFDAAGALVAAGPITYTIDPLGRRIARSKNGTRTAAYVYFDQLHPIAQLDANGELAERFVYGTRPNVPDYMIRGASTYRLISDERGSVRLVVEAATGAIAQRIDYDAFGVVLADSNPGFQPFGFAGGIYDPDTKLVHFGARDYDPSLGHFISLDPSGLSGGLDADLYAGGDPVNFIDPTGRFLQFVLPAIAGGIVGGGLEIVREAARGECINWGKVAHEAGKDFVKGLLIGGSIAVVGFEIGAIGESLAETTPVVGDLVTSLGETFEPVAETIDLANVTVEHERSLIDSMNIWFARKLGGG